MRYGCLLVTLVLLAMRGDGAAQYRRMQVPKGLSVPGENLIEVIVPEYFLRGMRFSEALKHVSKTFGLQLYVRINVSGEFSDPVINIAAKGVPLREVVNRIVRSGGVDEAEWYLDGSHVDTIHVNLGRISSMDPLSIRIKTWSSPAGYSPEEVINNILLYIPELRQRVFGNGGFIGSRGPVQNGCVLVYSANNMTAYEIVTQIARIAGKSWMFIHVHNDVKKSRITVF